MRPIVLAGVFDCLHSPVGEWSSSNRTLLIAGVGIRVAPIRPLAFTRTVMVICSMSAFVIEAPDRQKGIFFC